MTETERRVWSRLRGRQVGGFKFRRQVPVGAYVVDFLCVSDRLAIEVDGAGHEYEEKDETKTNFLQARGYRVLRIPASDVDESMDDVIHGIYLELAHPTPLISATPHPAAGATRPEPTSPRSGEAKTPTPHKREPRLA